MDATTDFSAYLKDVQADMAAHPLFNEGDSSSN